MIIPQPNGSVIIIPDSINDGPTWAQQVHSAATEKYSAQTEKDAFIDGAKWEKGDCNWTSGRAIYNYRTRI